MFMSSVDRVKKNTEERGREAKIKELKILGQQSAGVKLPLFKGVDKEELKADVKKRLKAVWDVICKSSPFSPWVMLNLCLLQIMK